MTDPRRPDDSDPNDPQNPSDAGGSNPESGDEFGLVAPTGGLAETPKGDRPASPEPPIQHRVAPKVADDDKPMAWKGFEETEEEDPDPDIRFTKDEDTEYDDLDMTPMVDVVFLLLIFFMVTASFTLQKSIEQPPSKIEDPSTNVVDEPEDEDDYVEVIIDQTNTYYVTSRDAEEVEAPSDREMRDRMRDAKLTTGAPRLIIRAHVDSLHKNVVKVWDAGNSMGFESIEMRTTDEDY